MADPLKVILTIATICSVLYVFGFAKSIISTGQISIEQFLWIVGSFAGVTAIGLLIWGLVSLAQRAARRKRASSLKARNPHISIMQ